MNFKEWLVITKGYKKSDFLLMDVKGRSLNSK